MEVNSVTPDGEKVRMGGDLFCPGVRIRVRSYVGIVEPDGSVAWKAESGS
jgi:hypothetical protein